MFSFKKKSKNDNSMDVDNKNAFTNNNEEVKDDEEIVDHAMDTAQLLYLLKCDDSLVPNREEIKQAFISKIRSENMVGLFNHACDLGLVVKDDNLISKMEKNNLEETNRLEKKQADMAENHGDIEVMETQLEIAIFKGLTGTKTEALDAYKNVASSKAMSTGQLIDVSLKRIILGFVWFDLNLVKENIAEAEILMEKGGDWDRRNRLKVYSGLYHLVSRNYDKASKCFLSGVATFTASELCTYETFIFYTVVTGLTCLSRVDFKKKIIDSPEVLTVIQEVPILKNFCNGLYDCDYKGFFNCLVLMNQNICTDRFLSVHKNWYFREVRVLAYTQFLESYKSVTISSMAKSFGVSIDFIDAELSHFIASGRINAKIDKVNGVIETTYSNETNSKYQSVIKQGDVLLNRVQMLSRAVNV